jgi:hypothetical protein
MVCRNGISLFNGATAEKISQEIEPTLARVNWAYGHLIWAAADPSRKRVFFGFPVDGSTTVNYGLCLDYQEGWGDPLANPGGGRKWSPWNFGTNNGIGSFGTIDPSDSRMVFCSDQAGSNQTLVKWPSATPNYYDVSGGNLNIVSYYVTAPVPFGTWGEYGFGGVSMDVSGVGQLRLQAELLDNSQVTLPQSGTYRTLSNPALHDTYIKAHLNAERLSLDILNGSSAGDFFSLAQLVVLAKRSPFMPARFL